MKKQSYAMIGTGALGGLYGGMLANAGHEVHFLLNRDYQHVVDHGLKVDSLWGDIHLHDIHAHQDASTLPPCDVTIVALKTTQNYLLPELLRPSTSGGGCVLVLQNGLNIEEDSAAVVGADRVLGGCCFLCSNKVGPGHIHHMDFGRIVFGEYASKEKTPRAERICEEMVAAKIDARVSGDLPMLRWRKLMWNIPFNGLSVTLDASTKAIVEDPHAEALADAIIREVHAGAAACGVAVREDAIEMTMDNTRKMVPYDSSMRLDFLNRRPMEIQAIFGNPLVAAKAHGCTMPRVEMLFQELNFINSVNLAKCD